MKKIVLKCINCREEAKRFCADCGSPLCMNHYKQNNKRCKECIKLEKEKQNV